MFANPLYISYKTETSPVLVSSGGGGEERKKFKKLLPVIEGRLGDVHALKRSFL